MKKGTEVTKGERRRESVPQGNMKASEAQRGPARPKEPNPKQKRNTWDTGLVQDFLTWQPRVVGGSRHKESWVS